jgi:hypothetical protein
MRALFTAILLFPTALKADTFHAFHSGNDMYELCQEKSLIADAYAAGVKDGSMVTDYIRGNQSPICLDKGVTVGQVSDVMCQYLEKYPEKRHLAASDLALNSFAEAWPCTR